MNVLIVEDNKNKYEQISALISQLYTECNIERAASFISGKNKVYENKWDIIIMDVTLPTYDITHTERGGDKRPVAGKNLMKRMINRKINIPVIVITQFETFDNNRISLASLNQEFEQEFQSIWKGTIFYEKDDWRLQLKDMLYNILGE